VNTEINAGVHHPGQLPGFLALAGIDSTSASIVPINRSRFTNNGTALETGGGGQIVSHGNNSFANNGTNAAPTKTISLF
jgi:hypothetical protein